MRRIGNPPERAGVAGSGHRTCSASGTQLDSDWLHRRRPVKSPPRAAALDVEVTIRRESGCDPDDFDDDLVDTFVPVTRCAG